MIKKLFRFLLKSLLWFFALSFLWVLLYKYVAVYYTPLMLIRKIEANEKHLFETKHHWIPISEISKNLQLAAICAEDQHFVNHNGFDFEAIEKAYENNKNGKRLKGGSTITQQVAKNVFLWPQRSWFRKGLETYFTFLIELLWSKERILEVYLNSIEMGEGIYGALAASQFWFNSEAKHLSKEQAAALVAILPNPRKYKATPPTSFIKKRKMWVLQQMRNYGTFTLSKSTPK